MSLECRVADHVPELHGPRLRLQELYRLSRLEGGVADVQVRYVLLLRAPPVLRQLRLSIVVYGLQHLCERRAAFVVGPLSMHLQAVQQVSEDVKEHPVPGEQRAVRCGVTIVHRHLEDPWPDQGNRVRGALSPTLQINPELQEHSRDAREDSHHHTGLSHRA